jgi:hypothetical protein
MPFNIGPLEMTLLAAVVIGIPVLVLITIIRNKRDE